MTAPRELADLQHWMLAAITDPGGVVFGSSPDEIDRRILPSRQQTATERLAVYSSAYFARLLGVLRELFPCLRFAVGDDLFNEFAVQYLAAHPPHSYTLHVLADRFADFLHATRPAAEDWTDFPVELARLEHAIDQVFDGPGPEEATASIRLSFVPGFRLLSFAWPVSSFYSAWKAGSQPPWPNRGAEFVALLRRDYIVRRYELSQLQFDLLSCLAAGRTLEESLQRVADLVTPDEIERWFTFWSAERFFVGKQTQLTE